MNKIKTRGPLLDHLDEIEAKCLEGDPTLQSIFDIFGPSGHYIISLFLVLPFLQPIPLLGLSSPFGILIALVAWCAFREIPPRIPRRWGERKISAKTVSKIAETSERLFEKLAVLLRPRFDFLFKGTFRLLNTTLIIFNALILALPLPIPFSNALPAWMIFFQILAHLEKDGLFILLSYVQAIVVLFFFFFLNKGLESGLKFFDSFFL
jgi:hypothetical protein